MTPKKKELSSGQVVEFSPGKDPFRKSRKKGPTRWILAHIFQGPNRVFIVIIIFMIIFAANLSSIVYIVIGEALSIIEWAYFIIRYLYHYYIINRYSQSIITSYKSNTG